MSFQAIHEGKEQFFCVPFDKTSRLIQDSILDTVTAKAKYIILYSSNQEYGEPPHS